MKGAFQVLKPEDMNDGVVQAILSLGMSTGTWQTSDIDYYTPQLVNPANINVVYWENGKILGHIMARPHNDVVDDYLELDPLINRSDVPMFYVDHLNVEVSVSGQTIGLKLILRMFEEANRREVYLFSNHCRTINGLSRMVQRKFKVGIKKVRRIECYPDCNNEPFDYIELEFRTRCRVLS